MGSATKKIYLFNEGNAYMEPYFRWQCAWKLFTLAFEAIE